MALSPGTRLGGYEIVAPVGAGGMGEVYRAREATLDRHVAIKVLPPRLADDAMALARFEREAKAVAALSHPNILSIFAFGGDGPVKILDFGLARQNAALASVDTTVSPGVERHTDPGTVLGTVGYMSPEQARGDAGDARSDLFSLG